MADNVISSFCRYEVKYFLTPSQYESILPVLKEHMTLDAYGEHTIGNIFFDTDDYSVTRASIEKPAYKEKLRVRAYGTPDPLTGKVFIELKKKYLHVVYKRRIMLTVPEAKAFLLEGIRPTSTDPQITAEIARFMELHHPVPKVFLSYDRVALFGKEDRDLRVTFDTDLRYRTGNLDLCAGSQGSPILPDNRILMEIKIPGVMPLWLSRTLSENHIFRTSFSKIGTCYTSFILPKIFVKKGRERVCSTVSSSMESPLPRSSSVPASL